jgi:hypothetical protein
MYAAAAIKLSVMHDSGCVSMAAVQPHVAVPASHQQLSNVLTLLLGNLRVKAAAAALGLHVCQPRPTAPTSAMCAACSLAMQAAWQCKQLALQAKNNAGVSITTSSYVPHHRQHTAYLCCCRERTQAPVHMFHQRFELLPGELVMPLQQLRWLRAARRVRQPVHDAGDNSHKPACIPKAANSNTASSDKGGICVRQRKQLLRLVCHTMRILEETVANSSCVQPARVTRCHHHGIWCRHTLRCGTRRIIVTLQTADALLSCPPVAACLQVVQMLLQVDCASTV